MSAAEFPFVDLRPTVLISRSRWDATDDETKRLLLREAMLSGARIDVVDDDAPEPKK